MINLLITLPKKLTIALSGGVDSVAITDFLSRKHNVSCAFFHHGTENSERAFEFVNNFCKERNLSLTIGYLKTEKNKKQSQEEFWRDERYKFLDQFETVITGHHLDDVVETYIWSSMHGTSKIIPTVRNNVLRPFLTTRKTEFVNWCVKRNIDWCEDTSNSDIKYTRNLIRRELLPIALKINPGLHKVVKKIVQNSI